MDILTDSLETNDFMEFEEALSAWDHRYQQISPGAFYGNLFHTQVGEVSVFRGHWERAIHYRGIAPKGTVALAVTLKQSDEGCWLGQRLGLNDIIVTGCGVEGEYRSPSLWDTLVCTIPRAELAQQIANITHDDPEKIIARGIAHLSPRMAAHVRRAILTYLGGIKRFGAGSHVQSMHVEKTSALVETLSLALVDSQRPRRASVALNRRLQIIRKAEEYVEQLGSQPLRISHLCNELGVGERSLQYAFQGVVDTSPLSYLKTQRLNQVRCALRDADPDELRIKLVAQSHGFRHLGNFCHDYKQLFGETPTVTFRSRR